MVQEHATQVAGTNMLVSQAYMSALPLHLSAYSEDRIRW